MAYFNFDSTAINTGTMFVFGSWSCTANRSVGFTSHLIDTTNAKASQQKELGETTSAESFLPRLAEDIERMSLLDMSSTRLLFGLGNPAASYLAILRLCRKNLIKTRTAPQFDSYPDSDDDFDLDSDLLNCPSLTILATPQSRFIY